MHTSALAASGPYQAGQVSHFLSELIGIGKIPLGVLARGMDLDVSHLNRMASNRKGTVKGRGAEGIRRLATLLEDARKTLTEDGLTAWLTQPNPYLDDVAPIQHIRTDKELKKVLAELVAMRHGFPA